MNLRKILLVFPMIKSFIDLYEILKIRIDQSMCDHKYKYWDTIFKEIDVNGDLKSCKFPTIQNSHRLCNKCGKKERLNMKVGNWHWERVEYEFPNSGSFLAIYNPRGIKTKQQMRDELLNELLNKIVK